MEYTELNEVLKNINASVVVYKVDASLRISMEYVNDRFAEIYGGDREALQEALKKDITFGVAEEYKQTVQEMFEQVVATGERGEAIYRATTNNAKEIWVNVKASPVCRSDDTLVYLTFFDITAQIKAMEMARRNEQYLQSACEFANIYTWIYYMDTKVIHTGKLLQDQIGLPERMENFPECVFALQMVNAEYIDLYRNKIAALDNGEKQVDFEVKADLPDGQTHWIAYRFNIVAYEKEKPKIAVGTAQLSDVNKQLEARYLIEQKRKIVDDPSMHGYVISNIQTGMVLERKNVYGKMQFSAHEMSYEKVADAFSKTIVSVAERKNWVDTHLIENMFALFEEGRTAIEFELNVLCTDGIMRWVREVMNLVKHPDTGELILYNYFYDIHNQRVFGDLMNAMADYGYEICGSLAANLDQLTMIRAGSNSHKMLIDNYTELNDNYSDIVSPEDVDRYREETSIPFIKMRTSGEENGYEMTFKTIENGEIRYKKAQCYLYNREEQTYLILRSDVTSAVRSETEKRKQLEAALVEAKQANLAKSSFLSRMSHELRTPLNAISGYTTLIEEATESDVIDSAALSENITGTQRATAYLLTIISDILDIQSIEQGKTVIHKEKINAESYMENVIKMIRNEAEAKNIAFSYERKTHFSTYYMLDGQRFQQVLLNVLHNAVKFTPVGGTIQMTGEIVEDIVSGPLLKIIVRDTGIGMSQSFVENGLFQKFAQENDTITSPYDGCGTGLFLSNELIRLMGGTITCHSEKGKGSEFVITLKAEPVQKRTRERRKRNTIAYDLSGIRVLLCEDNQMNQDIEKSILERMKCEVVIADDGRIGVEKFKESNKGYFDIVLMDIRMPNMDGLEATSAIRAIDREDAKRVPILAVSANAFEEDIQKSLAVGMNEHLAKPVDASILYSKIKMYCRDAAEV